MVLTAGPGVASTGQDRWAAPLPRLPWTLPFLLTWGTSLLYPPPWFQGLGLLPVQGEEGSCRPGGQSHLFSGAGIGDKGWISPPCSERCCFSQPFFFFPWKLMAVKMFTQEAREEQGLRAVKVLLGPLLPFPEIGKGWRKPEASWSSWNAVWEDQDSYTLITSQAFARLTRMLGLVWHPCCYCTSIFVHLNRGIRRIDLGFSQDLPLCSLEELGKICWWEPCI